MLEAVADGDLTQHVELHDGGRRLHGDLGRMGHGLNRLVDQLSMFTGEVTRVAAIPESTLDGREKRLRCAAEVVARNRNAGAPRNA